ncbi:MAG: 3-phosphoshikimate 1-carboxyvinyltransferase [Bacteroidia bacterium]
MIQIKLPGSKSISNRLLILKELGQLNFDIANLSDSEDTTLLVKALNDIRDGKSEINVGLAGTDLRFLCSYLSSRSDFKGVLTGEERLRERPINDLVETLRSIGANIKYVKKENYAPLQIEGKNLKGGIVSINSEVSSQFISALMLIAPNLENGLEINLKGKPVSFSYITLTSTMMEEFSVLPDFKDNSIQIKKGTYHYEKNNYLVESDWSAASYFYECISLGLTKEITIPYLFKNSNQPDSIVQEIFMELGVGTKFEDGNAILSYNDNFCNSFNYDFTNCPDIAQTVLVTCFAKNIPCKLNGLSTLKHKETDRIMAMKNELYKLGANIITGNDFIELTGTNNTNLNSNISIETYNDHRMAMCFAPLTNIFKNISINNPDVVKKSFPNFWTELQKVK